MSDWKGDKTGLPRSPGASGLTKLSVADPRNACGEQVKIEFGSIAVIPRGECSFDEKCLNAQRGGAKGCVVINSKDTVTTMNGGPESKKIKIPSIMVRQQAFKLMETNGFLSPIKGKKQSPQTNVKSKAPHLARIVYTN